MGKKIVDTEDLEAAKRRREREEEKKVSITGLDESNYRKEERVIYVTGYDRKTSFVDLEHFMKQYGEIVQVQKKIDEKGRGKGFVFVEYKTKESAEKAVEDSGRANLLGNRLTINYKISKVKVLEDRDCWFCIDNPKVITNVLLFLI
jgi:RNA recognition motif-containing protein